MRPPWFDLTPVLLPTVKALLVLPLLLAGTALVAEPSVAPTPAKRPMEIADLFRLHRLSDPQVSPDGRSVVYVVTDVVMDENRTQSDLWLVSSEGGEPRPLTSSPKNESHPRWSPDGKWIAFESDRDGDSQVWLLPVDGGEARKLTTLATGANQPVWSPDGRAVAFVSAVFPEFSEKPFAESDKLNKEKLAARETSKVKARVITSLLYRHWTSWVDDLRKHLFIVPVGPDGRAAADPRDVTPGENDAVPTSGTFASGDEFAFSPDSRELVFTAPPLPLREQAWSTNHDLWSVDLTNGMRRQLTTNPAADGRPRFSPDGRWLAYRAQRRAGFEADRWELMLLDRTTGATRTLTTDFDRSVEAFGWAPDSGSLFFLAEEGGTTPIWSVPLAGGQPAKRVGHGSNSDVSVAPDGRTLFFLQRTMRQPAEVMCLHLGDSSPRPVTRANADLLAALDLPEPEVVTVSGAGNTPVQMWIVKPPVFDAAKKYPLVFLVHGGPQGAWGDNWSYRWNPQLWGAQGYVVALPNPRGSTGFGQKFTDEISRDWGGRVFDDLMACLAFMERQPYVDTTRMAAAGASYGGYMMNWFQGHTDKFRTLVTHAGTYNLSAKYGVTEETWFAEWDLGIPWETADFEEFSPHRSAANFKTPNLIIHGELDFRIPVGEAMQLFTTLQRKGVPSKMLLFPDEGHWISKPQNSELWHRTVFEWLAEYLRK
jgi:dipeptidyl aminopeptidase/acylaminoacyl peptidase